MDPVALAGAQTTANIKTANALAQINRINQTTPTGSTTYTRTPPPVGPDTFKNSDGSTNDTLTQDQIDGGITQTKIPGTADPNAVDTWSQSTTLTPEQQHLLEGQQTLQNSAQDIAAWASPQLKANPTLIYGHATPTLNTTGPQVGQLATNALGGPIQSSLDFSGAPDMPQANTAAQKAVVDALYGQATSRLDPQWQQASTAMETKLANQGVVQNSDAWNKAMTQFQQGQNDAYTSALNSAIGAGTDTLTKLSAAQLAARQEGVNEATTQGTFANSAENQLFGQNFSNAQLQNAAEAQGFGEHLAGNTFSNNALQQDFGNNITNANLNNSTAQMQLQDLLAKYGLGSGNITMPSLPGVPQANVAPTDVIGAQGLSSNQAMANYQAQMQNNSAAKGGAGSLLGTGAMALALSDRRLKTDIRRIGTARNGLAIYSFRYIGHDEPQIGLMAQDVEKINPAAVHTIAGFKAVEYPAALAA